MGLSTFTTFWSLSVTITAFAPFPKHLVMQAAWLALAPFTPQLESLTYPFSVVVLSAAEATATIRNMTETAAKLIHTFFIGHLFCGYTADCKTNFAPLHTSETISQTFVTGRASLLGGVGCRSCGTHWRRRNIHHFSGTRVVQLLASFFFDGGGIGRL